MARRGDAMNCKKTSWTGEIAEWLATGDFLTNLLPHVTN